MGLEHLQACLLGEQENVSICWSPEGHHCHRCCHMQVSGQHALSCSFSTQSGHAAGEACPPLVTLRLTGPVRPAAPLLRLGPCSRDALAEVAGLVGDHTRAQAQVTVFGMH